MKNFGIMTARRNGLSAKQKASAVELVSLDDPLGRWGTRLIQEKLSGKGIHIPWYVIDCYFCISFQVVEYYLLQ